MVLGLIQMKGKQSKSTQERPTFSDVLTLFEHFTLIWVKYDYVFVKLHTNVKPEEHFKSCSTSNNNCILSKKQ